MTTNDIIVSATGRRKNAVARVRLRAGNGTITVNEKPYDEVFTVLRHQRVVERPMKITETNDRFDVQVKIEGGGISAWADAIAHGIAKALVANDENVRKPLRNEGLMTRDARVKERKKYGLKRARKAPQYTKR